MRLTRIHFYANDRYIGSLDDAILADALAAVPTGKRSKYTLLGDVAIVRFW